MVASFIEIERKFLVRGAWPLAATVHVIRQLYLDSGGQTSVRLRDTDGVFSLTLKSGIRAGVRNEFEIPVALETGTALYALHHPHGEIIKHRHHVEHAGQLWEVDVFGGVNSGLIVAEIELRSETEPVHKPDWLGPEVTHDKRFTNHALSRHPFGRWGISYSQLLGTLAPVPLVI